MIQYFQNLLLIEQIILGVYIVLGIAALIGFTYDGAAHAGQLFKTVKSLLWPSWFFRMWGFIAREHESSVIVKAFLKGSITFAYMPTVAWVIAWVVSNFYPIPPQYLDFAVPMTFSKGLELSGYRVIEIDWLLKWIPTPFVYSESLITMQGLSLGWFMANMLRLNARADVLFKKHDFKKDFLEGLEAVTAFPEVRTGKKPYVRVATGQAFISTTGVSLSLDKIKQLAPVLQSRMGCRFIKIDEGDGPGSCVIDFSYRGFPKLVRYRPSEMKHPNPNFIPLGTDMRNMVGHDFDFDPHMLIAGLPGRGKTVTLVTVCIALFNQNPNTILIVIDSSSKQGIDFGFLEFDPKERNEYLTGNRDLHEVHTLPLVMIVKDYAKVPQALGWVQNEMNRRARLCGDMRYKVPNMSRLYQHAYYKEEKQPRIVIMTDESAFLEEMIRESEDRSGSSFREIARTGRALDINIVQAIQEPVQKNLGGKRNLLKAYSFFLPQAHLKLLDIDFQMPDEKGVFCYLTKSGGVALAKAYMSEEDECANFIAEQTKKANQTTHRLFRELVACVNQAFRDDMMEKVERKLQTSAIGHREPVITGNYREAA